MSAAPEHDLPAAALADTVFVARRRELLAELARILPATRVISEPEMLRVYECDGLSAYRQAPLAVALPDSEAEVVAILKLCRRLGVPVVARGAGTGLSGGAYPHAQGLLLVTARMNRMLEINAEARYAIVEPGVRNLAISEAVAAHGLYYAPDPSSQLACSIGGNVAENAGGIHCLKYGLTVHNVLALRLVTIDGEVLELGHMAPESAGLDLLALAIGSEGLLGVVTEVTVRLLPRPPLARCLLAAFADLAAAGEAVAAIIAAGVIPAGLELMDRGATEAVERYIGAGYPADAAAILLVESDGDAHTVAAEIEQVCAILTAHGATELRLAADEAERQRFWAGRKAAFPATGTIAPDYYCMDGTIPRRHLGDMLTAIAAMQARFGLRCVNVFHAGDGNLHPLILYDANESGALERAEAFGAEILELTVRLGGSITGEHGVGIEKIGQMCVQFGEAERHAMHRLKAAFDPPGLLNPGKAIPSLHRCAEYGSRHGHHGTPQPFAELPRF
ncbi:MAG TPA: FAD-linked oxidase C-terminal domain-containing protein [Rhodocyclaceae bacterium]|nr:FAD-linked oxidase C-terminal domain-containing protein [Rhodocyclaceae bacterium]